MQHKTLGLSFNHLRILILCVISPYQVPKFRVEGVDVKNIKIRHLQYRKKIIERHAYIQEHREEECGHLV